ncbi:hypothetical protein M9H77_07981 [Catharanthus roseus]|uniref:Uncharacterized protein n=1 Tax=Catharanthus roseus TaxID=4058 RepID=A0ACC0BWL1_CATRO|nr:hypothetical protein M9H77_07981 [Catharanthus roseus]
MFRSVRGLHCTWLISRTRASSNNVDGFKLWRVDPLERGGTSHHALWWDGRLVKSQEGLDTKISLKYTHVESLSLTQDEQRHKTVKEGLKFKKEGLEDYGNPPKLHMLDICIVQVYVDDINF